MRRVLPVAVLLAAAVAALALTGAGAEREGLSYRVMLDNAFGLTEGADLRADGVRVGSVEDLEVDIETARAVATVVVERPEFAGLRTDVFCSVEPQSLIGEYFMDCEPGRAERLLPDGATIPVEQTGGTVPPDLVNNILRRPYRERLGILLAEFGAAFAARGDDINATIERAIPALRETDRVLRILSEERQTLRQLTRDGETVITRMAQDRRGLSRFVSEARDAAAASADRRQDLATTFRLLPRFQRELRPTLSLLGRAAREQTPALADLRASAPQLERLLRNLGPFADASRPAIRSLADVSAVGRRAVRAARPTVEQLEETATAAVDPFTNLRFVLEHLDNRKFAVEPNPQSPNGAGFTGLEAFLQYPFVQSQAINIFDVRGYILKLNILINECSQYTDARGRLRDPERAKRCNADLGPGSPPLQPAAEQEAQFEREAEEDEQSPLQEPGGPGQPPEQRSVATSAEAPSAGGARRSAPAAPQLPNVLELPGLPPIKVPLPSAGKGSADAEPLLDLLLRP